MSSSDDYEEDFESFSDEYSDFEDINELEQHNTSIMKIVTSSKREFTINDETKKKKKENIKTSNINKKRYNELIKTNKITLNVEDLGDIFELLPISKSDQYKRKLTSKKIRNVGIQYNSDWLDSSAQTDEIIMLSKSVSTDASVGNNSSYTNINANNIRLNKFLTSASNICESLIVNRIQAIDIKNNKQENMNKIDPFSSYAKQSIKIDLPDECGSKNRYINDIYCSKQYPNLFIVAYSPCIKHYKSTKDDDNDDEKENKDHISILNNNFESTLKHRGLIIVWDISGNQVKVLRILYCDSNPTSIQLYQSYLVIAGMSEGFICLWDIRNKSINNIQAANFSTDHLYHENHQDKIIQLKVIPEQNKDVMKSAQDTFDVIELATYNKSSFQIATMDTNANLYIWTIIQHNINSSFYIIKNTSLSINKIVNNLTFNPLDSNEIFLSSNNIIKRIKRFGSLNYPSQYICDNDNNTCIKFINNTLFIAGYTNGIIRLYSIDQANYLYSYQLSNYGIIQIEILSNHQRILLLNTNGMIYIIEFMITKDQLYSHKIHYQMNMLHKEQDELLKENDQIYIPYDHISYTNNTIENILVCPSNTTLSSIHLHRF